MITNIAYEDNAWVVHVAVDDQEHVVLVDEVEHAAKVKNFWMADPNEETALLVIIMPAPFIVMALRAELRVLEFMTGSGLPHVPWEARKLLLMSTYTSDLEVADCFQFVTVLAFGCLCAMYLRSNDLVLNVSGTLRAILVNTSRSRHGNLSETNSHLLPHLNAALKNLEIATHDNVFSLRWAGLQGIWFYVIVGMIRSTCSITLVTMAMSGMKEQAATIHDVVLSKLDVAFVLVTALCIYNMMVVLSMRELKDVSALGKWASQKFLACRALLVLSQVQPTVITILAEHPELGLKFSPMQGRLLHSTLLATECLLLAVSDYIMWRVVDRDDDAAKAEGYEELQGCSRAERYGLARAPTRWV
eukprot:NODE_5445_length_1769_cov_9.696102.p1 GENE.NODE_5445_length_1769_cov_9.696102~~NODE_5445_length_1769_cov_9.696102.p1  ORF type:complete len:360 (+),score=96.75 NODE_5445_length_1769_cov_9.696102:567-1646(+)